jgi:hypothetical protein
MATITDQTDQSGQTDVNAPKAVGGTGGGGAGFATTTGGGTGKEAPGGYGGVAPGSQSGSFQNVNAILNANKNSNIAGGIVGADQAQAGQFNQSVGQQAAGATNAINGQWNAATGGTGGTEQQAAQNIQNDVAGTANAGQAGSGWTANAQGNLVNQNATNQYQAALNTQYQAPNVNWANAQQQAQNFQQQGQNAQSATGQLALLQGQYGSPSYSQGQQSIDQLLLQNNPQEQHNLGQLQQIAGQTQGTLNTAQNQVTTAGQGVQNNISQLNQAAQNALTGTIGTTDSNAQDNTAGNYGTGLLGNLGSQAAQEVAASNNAYSQAQADINQGNYSPLLSVMGVNSGQNTYGLTPTQIAQFLTGPTGSGATPTSGSQLTPGLAGTMTAQQANQVNALNQLAGTSGLTSSLQSQLGLGSAPAQAGTVQAYTPTYNAAGLQTALTNAQSGLESGLAPLIGQINSGIAANGMVSGPINNEAYNLASAAPGAAQIQALQALANGEQGGGQYASQVSQLLDNYGGTFGAGNGTGTGTTTPQVAMGSG